MADAKDGDEQAKQPANRPHRENSIKTFEGNDTPETRSLSCSNCGELECPVQERLRKCAIGSRAAKSRGANSRCFSGASAKNITGKSKPNPDEKWRPESSCFAASSTMSRCRAPRSRKNSADCNAGGNGPRAS